MRLVDILKKPSLDGNRKMLTKIYGQFGNIEVGEDLVPRILTHSVENDELFRLLTGGKGMGKCHASANSLAYNANVKEGRLKRRS